MSFTMLAAVPSHSGSMTLEGVHTLLNTQRSVTRLGGVFDFHYEYGSTVSLVRNAIVAQFLSSTADLLLMLDADQGAAPEAIERMIQLDQPVVGCIYPKRAFDWSRVQLDRITDTDHLVEQAAGFVGCLESDEQGEVKVVNGFAKAIHIGTGMILLRRDAFDTLKAAYPELKGRGFGPDAYASRHSGSERWGFFNPIDNEQGVPLSEDISFCHRWRNAGGEIWANISDTLVHVGRHEFVGNFMRYLTRT